jgi:hypothetical protein
VGDGSTVSLADGMGTRQVGLLAMTIPSTIKALQATPVDLRLVAWSHRPGVPDREAFL